MVIRDALRGRVLWRKYVTHETIADYMEGVDWLRLPLRIGPGPGSRLKRRLLFLSQFLSENLIFAGTGKDAHKVIVSNILRKLQT